LLLCSSVCWLSILTCLAFSSPAFLCRILQSCIFTPCNFLCAEFSCRAFFSHPHTDKNPCSYVVTVAGSWTEGSISSVNGKISCFALHKINQKCHYLQTRLSNTKYLGLCVCSLGFDSNPNGGANSINTELKLRLRSRRKKRISLRKVWIRACVETIAQ